MARPEAPAEGRKWLKGFWLALAGSAGLATNFITAKYALAGFNLNTFTLVWAALAAAVGFVWLVGAGRLGDIRLPAGSILPVTAMGILTGLSMLLAWAGLELLDPALAAFFRRFVPVVGLALGAIFLQERLDRREVVPAGLMILGSALSAAGRWQSVGLGLVLSLFSCLAIAGQMFLAKVCLKEVSAEALVFYRSLIAAIFALGWLLFRGGADFSVAPSYWIVSVLGVLLAPVLGQLFIIKSYHFWQFSQTMIIFTLQPLFVLAMAYFCLGTWPDSQDLLGGATILAGAVWLNLGRGGRGAA